MLATVKFLSGLVGLLPSRQRDRRNMQRIVEVQPGQIGGDRLRNIVGGHPKLDRVIDDVERAAALDAGRGFVIDEVHGHFEAQARAGLQAQEVDVNRMVLDDVELIIARNGALGLAVDFEFEDRRQEVPREDELGHGSRVERERRRRLSATIEHGGRAAFTACAAGGPLACPTANRGREFFGLGHCLVLLQK